MRWEAWQPNITNVGQFMGLGRFLKPCQPQTGPANAATPVSPSNSCDASKAHVVIGSSANGELLEQARVAAHAASARFLRPNEPITTELLPSRLNLGLNQQDRVSWAYCG